MQPYISLEEAQDLLLSNALTVAPTRVPLWGASGRVLSDDIFAQYSIPYFDRSAVDGYALKTDELITASSIRPVKLNLLEQTDARFAEPKLEVGYCLPVGTGDRIPAGADSVVRFEDVIEKGNHILVNQTIHLGDNVVPCGEDIWSGDIIARRGSKICSPLAAVLAGQGLGQVPVYHTVKIAIISTGEELLDPSEEFQVNKIYNSVLYGLNARCYELGTQAVNLGSVPDDTEVTAALINRGLGNADLVVITGGVSVGSNDVVEASLRLAGARLLFHGVAMKPGSPTLAASKDGKLVIGLSGNPAAALVSFELIVVPIIKKIMGLSQMLPIKIHGVMTEAFNKPSKQRRFLRAQLFRRDSEDMVRLTGAQGNAVLMSMIGCNLLVDIPAGSGPVTSGQTVAGWLINSEGLIYNKP